MGQFGSREVIRRSRGKTFYAYRQRVESTGGETRSFVRPWEPAWASALGQLLIVRAKTQLWRSTLGA